MFLLKSYNLPIPGNYEYVQNLGDDREYRFKAMPVIEELAKAVSAFRVANHLPRASLAECLEDIDKFNCAIRNNDSRVCWDCASTFAQARASHPFLKPPCPSCGKPLNE